MTELLTASVACANNHTLRHDTGRDLEMSDQPPARNRKPAKRQAALSMRIAPATRDQLVAIAKENGRSVTQEADRLLDQAIFMRRISGEWHATRLWAAVIGEGEAAGARRAKERQVGGGGDWSFDQDCYLAAIQAVIRRLLELSPWPLDTEYMRAMLEETLAQAQRWRADFEAGLPVAFSHVTKEPQQ